MKKIKKIVFFVIIIIGGIILLVYKLKSNNEFEEFEELEGEFEYNKTITSNNNLKNTEDFESIENAESNENNENTKEEDYIILHITGQVNNPGIVKVKVGSRIIDVIEKADGLTKDADTNRINLAYIVSDGQKIYIPSIYDEDERTKDYIEDKAGQNIIEESPFKMGNKININTATQTELETLTGIGPSTALKIINYRNENGNFKNIEEIKNVPGIGETKFNTIKNEICI